LLNPIFLDPYLYNSPKSLNFSSHVFSAGFPSSTVLLQERLRVEEDIWALEAPWALWRKKSVAPNVESIPIPDYYSL